MQVMPLLPHRKLVTQVIGHLIASAPHWTVEDVLNTDAWMSGDEGTRGPLASDDPAEMAVDPKELKVNGKGNGIGEMEGNDLEGGHTALQETQEVDWIAAKAMGREDYAMEEEQRGGENQGFEERKGGVQEKHAWGGMVSMDIEHGNKEGSEPMDIRMDLDSEKKQGIQETQEGEKLAAAAIGLNESMEQEQEEEQEHGVLCIQVGLSKVDEGMQEKMEPEYVAKVGVEEHEDMGMADVVMSSNKVTQEEEGSTDSESTNSQEEGDQRSPTTGSKHKILRISNSCYRPRKKKRLDEGKPFHTPNGIAEVAEWARVC
jgi:hypothetical protein